MELEPLKSVLFRRVNYPNPLHAQKATALLGLKNDYVFFFFSSLEVKELIDFPDKYRKFFSYP